MTDSGPKGHPHVVHEDDLPWIESAEGARFASRRRRLGHAAGAEQLGASLMEVPPGKQAWPCHYHFANEEALYVLEGEGTLRIGDDEVPVRKGAFVALPVGERSAHALVNTGSGPLRYLALSTMREPDVTVYPDSGKVGLFAGAAPGGDAAKRTLSAYLKADAVVPYWEGEGDGDG